MLLCYHMTTFLLFQFHNWGNSRTKHNHFTRYSIWKFNYHVFSHLCCFIHRGGGLSSGVGERPQWRLFLNSHFHSFILSNFHPFILTTFHTLKLSPFHTFKCSPFHTHNLSYSELSLFHTFKFHSFILNNFHTIKRSPLHTFKCSLSHNKIHTLKHSLFHTFAFSHFHCGVGECSKQRLVHLQWNGGGHQEVTIFPYK